MPRNLNDIQQSILDQISKSDDVSTLEVLTNKEQSLSDLTSASRVAAWRYLVFCLSIAIWTIESLFDIFRKEVDNTIALQKLHTAAWYNEKARAFQYGDDLISDTDIYDNTGLTLAEIEAKKIVKYAAVQNIDGILQIKVAKEESGVLAALNEQEITALDSYMNEIADAGTSIQIYSRPADDLKLQLDIHYNPQIMNGSGVLLDGSSASSVQEAINSYLRNLKFNGEFVRTQLEDAIQSVSGVEAVTIRGVFARFGSFDFQPVVELYLPDAGYMTLTEDSSISYLPRNVR